MNFMKLLGLGLVGYVLYEWYKNQTLAASSITGTTPTSPNSSTATTGSGTTGDTGTTTTTTGGSQVSAPGTVTTEGSYFHDLQGNTYYKAPDGSTQLVRPYLGTSGSRTRMVLQSQKVNNPNAPALSGLTAPLTGYERLLSGS